MCMLCVYACVCVCVLCVCVRVMFYLSKRGLMDDCRVLVGQEEQIKLHDTRRRVWAAVLCNLFDPTATSRRREAEWKNLEQLRENESLKNVPVSRARAIYSYTL